jgi:hypothetical protein
VPDPYIAERAVFLREELARIEAEIESISELDGEGLDRRFVPEAFRPESEFEPVEFVETLARGAVPSVRRVVVDSRSFG